MGISIENTFNSFRWAERIKDVADENTPSEASRDVKASAKANAQERREIWQRLSAAISGTDRDALRKSILCAKAAGFSAVTLRSANKRLLALGGSAADL